MSTAAIAGHIESYASYAETAPLMIFFFIILFMTIESSFIPFPSEVVMIPAGFLAYRYALPTGNHAADLVLVILCGLIGSLLGAYINYFLSKWLGRPFLHRYGKYFFLKEHALNRAEEVFREYGEIVTFVCRLIPAIRQLISIPAGLSNMKLTRFTLFTGLGAGIWSAVLAGIGYFFGHMTKEMTYLQMVDNGIEMIRKHYLWLFLGLAVLVAGYLWVHKLVMKSKHPAAPASPPEEPGHAA